MKDLIQLYYVSSPSGKEKRMRKHLKEWIKNNVRGAKVYADQSGIYVTKGEAESYPCVCAHIDEVHRERNNDFRVVTHEDYIFGYNVASHEQYGIGADDKNGIWVAMQCLLRYDVMKVALFVGEEVGCVGSGEAPMSFFDDCRFVLQCDRRGSSDFITKASGWELCDDAFLSKIDIARYGYTTTSGMMTDVMELKSRGLKVAACNISCGYYNPHTSTETTVFSQLCNCRDLVYHIIETVREVCPHEAKRSYSTYSYGSYWRGWGSRYDGDDLLSDANGNVYSAQEQDEQYMEMRDYMIEEWSCYPESFDPAFFYDSWKTSFPALTKADFDDAYAEIESWLAYQEDGVEMVE